MSDKLINVLYNRENVASFAAAWCLWSHYEDHASYVACDYGEPPPDVYNAHVTIVGFSYPREIMENLVRKNKTVTCISHDETTIKTLTGLPGLHFICSTAEHVASMAWKHVYPTLHIPKFIQCIEDHDLRLFRLSMSKEFYYGMSSIPYDFQAYESIFLDNTDAIEQLKEVGGILLKKHLADITVLLKVCQRSMNIGGHIVPVANLPYTMTDDACEIMCQTARFAACYTDTPSGRIFSLRSKQGVGKNVGEIAKIYPGGSGNHHAASFTVSRNHILAQS